MIASPDTRFHGAFAAREAGTPPGLIPYFTAGYPSLESLVELLLCAQRTGCIAAEVGIPFSDPLADGPTIQRTGQVALRNGMTLAAALAQVAEARGEGVTIPLAVMTYVNPVLSFGVHDFARAAAAAGVDGVIVPDLPLDEAAGVRGAVHAAGIALIPLVAPTTTPDRLARTCSTAAGFVYCVGVTGVTGARVHDQRRCHRAARRGAPFDAAAACPRFRALDPRARESAARARRSGRGGVGVARRHRPRSGARRCRRRAIPEHDDRHRDGPDGVTLERVSPAAGVDGEVTVPGDKSISHRALILGALARGRTYIGNASPAADVLATAACLRACGAWVRDFPPDRYALDGAGVGVSLRSPGSALDCGNSGTTMRLLAGALAGSECDATLDGDGSLRRRPMLRVVDPLRAMGALRRRLAGRDRAAPRPGQADARGIDLAIAGCERAGEVGDPARRALGGTGRQPSSNRCPPGTTPSECSPCAGPRWCPRAAR